MNTDTVGIREVSRIEFGTLPKSVQESDESRKSKSHFCLRLQDRDYRIFSFLLDQKFASIEQIYYLFFDSRKLDTDPLPNEFFVARQRLRLLIKANFIQTERVYSKSKSMYLLTLFGFKHLQGYLPNQCYREPLLKIDYRTFEHDYKVTNCRIAIEKTGRCKEWISDRRIRSCGFEVNNGGRNKSLPKGIVPDGIFITNDGKRIAFELETSVRKRSRHELKLQAFKQTLFGSDPLFHRLIWTGASERILSDLRRVIGTNPNVQIETYEKFEAKAFAVRKEATP